MERRRDGVGDDRAGLERNLLRQAKYVFGRRHDVLGETAVDVIAEHLVVVADVLAALATGAADAASQHRRQQNRVAILPARDPGAESCDGAADLVAENQRRRLEGRGVVVDEMQVSVAEAAGGDPDQNLAWTGFRRRDLGHFERTVRGMENGCLHRSVSLGFRV